MSGRDGFIGKYFDALIAKIFKILPMWENCEESLQTYLNSLCMEMYGSTKVFRIIQYDPSFATLLSLMAVLRDNPGTDVLTVRREVFHAISICKSLRSKYSIETIGGDSDGCD